MIGKLTLQLSVMLAKLIGSTIALCSLLPCLGLSPPSSLRPPTFFVCHFLLSYIFNRPGTNAWVIANG